MASNERIRKYLDAGSVLGQLTRGRAEEIVRELVNAGEIPRSQAQERVDAMVERSKRTSENLLEVVRREVHAQLSKIDPASIEEIANRVAVVLKKSAEAGRNATAGAAGATKAATQQATQAAKDATAGATKQATNAAKTATAGATKAAKEARRQAEKTAGRAKGAAGGAVPKRAKAKKSKEKSKDKDTAKEKNTAKKDGHKGDPTKDKAEKAKHTDEAVSETKTAPKKAS
jgi:polyhydroxyalkanoate synthesis regulator phasin